MCRVRPPVSVTADQEHKLNCTFMVWCAMSGIEPVENFHAVEERGVGAAAVWVCKTADFVAVRYHAPRARHPEMFFGGYDDLMEALERRIALALTNALGAGR